MSVTAKLSGFAVVLAALFGVAAVAGSSLHPLRAASASAGGTEMSMAADGVRGLAVSDGALTLALERRALTRGRATPLAFRIIGGDGRPVRSFEVEHTKRMHLIVVRRDLTGFQHLHPVQSSGGRWVAPITLATGGTYRVFADFSVDGTRRTLADDLQVDGGFESQPLPSPTRVIRVDGLRVALDPAPSRAGAESELRFDVTRNGEPVRIQDYLGAKGHLVALRDGDLAFLHVHPDADRLQFDSTFPSAGRYRLFLQFKVDGRIHTAAFTRQVVR